MSICIILRSASTAKYLHDVKHSKVNERTFLCIIDLCSLKQPKRNILYKNVAASDAKTASSSSPSPLKSSSPYAHNQYPYYKVKLNALDSIWISSEKRKIFKNICTFINFFLISSSYKTPHKEKHNNNTIQLDIMPMNLNCNKDLAWKRNRIYRRNCSM